jgi:hypothetical protein
MTKAVTDVVAKPVRAYRKASSARVQQLLEDVTAVTPGSGEHTTSNNLRKAQAASPLEPQGPRSCGVLFGAAAVACASSLGHILTLHTKGVFVDVPLATTEGLRAIPRLYGQEVRDHGPIRDWKSGAEVAGKNFAYGMTEGIVDLFVEPVRGGRQEGALGVAKGLGKGLVSFGTKIPSGKSIQIIKIMAYNLHLILAGLGLLAYTGQGIYKSMRRATRAERRHAIKDALQAEGQHLLNARYDRESLIAHVLDTFRSRLQKV